MDEHAVCPAESNSRARFEGMDEQADRRGPRYLRGYREDFTRAPLSPIGLWQPHRAGRLDAAAGVTGTPWSSPAPKPLLYGPASPAARGNGEGTKARPGRGG